MVRGHYGVDAPDLLCGFLAVGAALGFVGFALLHWSGARTWAVRTAVALLLFAGYALFMCAYMLWGSLVIKVRGRDAILDLVPWTGHEQVLDVGCGRGLLLVGAAHRLTTGRAVGVDLWRQKDQSANRQAATLENARLEKVADRVHVETGDMRRLPFADESFDVVVSSWAVHNLEARPDREPLFSRWSGCSGRVDRSCSMTSRIERNTEIGSIALGFGTCAWSSRPGGAIGSPALFLSVPFDPLPLSLPSADPGAMNNSMHI